jgi:hypothetical protein
LKELTESVGQIRRAGDIIVRWFDRYCAYYAITPAVLPSVMDDNPGIGAQEKV